MKLKLLCLTCLFVSISWAKPKKIAATVPSIGIILQINEIYSGTILFKIKIKNTGEETLTNIIVNDYNTPATMQFQSGGINIPSLAPGQEITNLDAFKYGNFECVMEFHQVQVVATIASGNQITDISSSDSYYNDDYTISYFEQYVETTQSGLYLDMNFNSIVDVGDVVQYYYNIDPTFSWQFQIYDDNAQDIIPGVSTATGIHYITQADIDFGYVYNTSYVYLPGTVSLCTNGIYYFQNSTYCSGCPNPNGANIITKLTSSLPNKISGSVKFNVNNDCNTAIKFPGRRVNTNTNTHNYTTFTNAVGDYEILIPNSGNYNTTALNNLSANFSSNPTSVLVTSSGENINYNNTNFCISSSTNYSDLRVNLFNVNQAIPGFAATYRLYFENVGTTSLEGNISLVYNSSILASVVGTPNQDTEIGDVLTWNFTNLLPFERRYIEISSLVLPPPAVSSGDINTLTLTGTTTILDNNLTNNTFVLDQSIVSSFDPNDKTVLEGEVITANQATNYLNYLTRFQNTGTANATTVVVRETLDADLDWNTFEPIDASHANNIQIRNGNQLTYTFSNIDLAFESANEPASHGWLAYRIKPKSTFAIGDVATSKSAIYFDFNPSILTNEVNTAIEVLATSGFTKNQFVIYPNPAKNFITIENKSNLISQYEILSANGQSLMKNAIENKKPIDISALQNGFYFITLKTSEGNATYKFIKN